MVAPILEKRNNHLSTYMFVGSSHRRQSELITISDDSDEEPLTRVASSPVYVPDDDDDVSILEVMKPSDGMHCIC